MVFLTELCHMEKNLDPQDWDALRSLGHRMLDDMLDHIRDASSKKVWTPTPSTVIDALHQPLPQKPQPAEEVYADFSRLVLPYNINNAHPRFWGWVQGGGTPFGMMADMLASGMNTNVSIGENAPVHVERQVLDWSKEIFGFPKEASGILTSGASMANITAMIVARNHFHQDIKRKGIRAVAEQMTIYGSSETHNCVVKGIEAIGIGADNFKRAPIDEDYRVRIDALEDLIRNDIAAGLHPFCIIGNAGTVNTGAIDDLQSLAALAEKYNCWFHIDGAFGAIPIIVPAYAEKLKGLQRADSLSFDFHKWFYMNYEVGCLLVKDAAVHKAAFTSSVSYLLTHERGMSAGPEPFANYGMELSRGFKALKVWMLLKEHGIHEYARQVERNLAQAQYLGELILRHPSLELLARPSMNIVCYRFNPGNHADLNTLNKEIIMRLHEEGIAGPTYTILDGRYTIRVAITNHRSRLEDFDLLVDATLRIGNDLIVT
jgi:glutamate/tyrosine decarboxylase-like PLP-dependent enzyme